MCCIIRKVNEMEDYREVKFDQIAYNNAYAKEHYDKITIVVPKGTKGKFKDAAKESKLSVTQYILQAVEFFEQHKENQL